MSPGTALQDRNDKLAEYTQIDSLQAYVLIAQDEPKVEVFRRHEANRWLYEYVTGIEAEIEVPLMGADVRLYLSQIYRRVQWDIDSTSTEVG